MKKILIFVGGLLLVCTWMIFFFFLFVAFFDATGMHDASTFLRKLEIIFETQPNFIVREISKDSSQSFVTILNRSKGLITIIDVLYNTDCPVNLFRENKEKESIMVDKPFSLSHLEYVVAFGKGCKFNEVTIVTNRGSATYKF